MCACGGLRVAGDAGREAAGPGRDPAGAGSRSRAYALGDHDTPELLGALELACTGALVHAGMGYTSYARMADRLAEMADLILPEILPE